MRRLAITAVIAIWSLFLAACGSGDSPSVDKATASGGTGNSSPIVFKVAYGATSASIIPFWLGIDSGIFKKHGLDVELVLLPGTKAPPALTSGSVQLAASGLPDLAAPVVKGADVSIVGTNYPWLFFQLYGQKGMKGPNDLRGKVIAASSPGSSSDTAITLAMKSAGMERDRDYKVTYVGDNSARLGALEKGVVDAIIVSPPTAMLVAQRGFPKVMDMIADRIPFGYSSFGVGKKWAAENRQTLLNFLAAYAESIKLGKSDKEAAYATERKYLKLSDQSMIEQVYDVSAAIMPEYPITEINVVTGTLAGHQDPAVRKADPNTIFDNSYVEAAKKAGP